MPQVNVPTALEVKGRTSFMEGVKIKKWWGGRYLVPRILWS